MFRNDRRSSGGFGGGFRRDDNRSFNLPKPVEVGKEYEVEISEVGAKGDGIARLSNFVIFVPNTQKGEKVKVKINSVGRSFAVAEKVGGHNVAAAPTAEVKVEAEIAGELDAESEEEEVEETVAEKEADEEAEEE